MNQRGRELAAARREALPATDEVVAELEAHQRLMQAVHELDPRHREVLVLRFLRGLPPREIAQQLGLDAATVSNRIQTGLRRLRERLDRDEGGRAAWMGWLLPLTAAPRPSPLSLGVLALQSKSLVAAAVLVMTTARSSRTRSVSSRRCTRTRTVIVA